MVIICLVVLVCLIYLYLLLWLGLLRFCCLVVVWLFGGLDVSGWLL